MVESALRRGPMIAHGRLWRPILPRTRLLLRVDLEAAASVLANLLPMAVSPCCSKSRGEWHALWLGPDEQLLLGPEPAGADMAAAASAALRDLPHSLVDVSHRQGAVEITGPHAAALINAGCPLDIGLGQFPVESCTRTIFAKTEIVLWRRASEQFHVEIWRSFMPYLAGFLGLVEREFQA